MTDIRIRPATLADLETVSSLFDAYRQFYQQAPDLDLARTFIAERMRRGECIVLLAEDGDGQAVGFCQLYPSFCSVEATSIYALYDLFVAPQCRRSGVGRGLLLAAEAEAGRRGASRMDLTTARSNRAAQSLYESLGWIRDEVFLAYSRRIPAGI
ncbi:GNAT family N-acetyltransferase [Variovorax sp. YR216]|uniref:GNAT family N-acetyltransferase n=1 Tax=Variovorax sp. YR216 TaxID=1882828 RepID=UPI00089867EB|nr:GNAT family N-acetyltransferase [Variovorax sp. YR216]SEA49054.1 Ribosomal protein S18 acetylase RimI [Variovorax sp. YR216]